VELDFNDNQVSSPPYNNTAPLPFYHFHLQITEIKGLNALVNLKVLDLSYNRISKIEGRNDFSYFIQLMRRSYSSFRPLYTSKPQTPLLGNHVAMKVRDYLRYRHEYRFTTRYPS